MLMPMLTEADPRISAEGSIDPLGMFAIADALVVRIIPDKPEMLRRSLQKEMTRFENS